MHPTINKPDVDVNLDDRQKSFMTYLRRKPLLAIRFAKLSTAIYNKVCVDCRIKAQTEKRPEFCSDCKNAIRPELEQLEKIRGEVNDLARRE